jgi:hypothetical protein
MAGEQTVMVLSCLILRKAEATYGYPLSRVIYWDASLQDQGDE